MIYLSIPVLRLNKTHYDNYELKCEKNKVPVSLVGAL